MSDTTDELERFFDRVDREDLEDDAGIECKHCGLDLLYWEEGRGEHNRKRWVLIDSRTGEPHNCIAYASSATADEFGPIT